MSERPTFEQEARDIVVKSSFTGVAATVIAVTIFSPAGLGGMVGTGVASGFGVDNSRASASNPHANLPPYTPPLTSDEISEIQGELASSAASMAITRQATDTRIEHVRSIAMAEGVVTFAPMPAIVAPQLAQTATTEPELRLTFSEASPVVEQASAPASAVEAALVPVSYDGVGSGAYSGSHRVSHLELADLFVAFDAF